MVTCADIGIRTIIGQAPGAPPAAIPPAPPAPGVPMANDNRLGLVVSQALDRERDTARHKAHIMPAMERDDADILPVVRSVVTASGERSPHRE
jgi:hypothetical protein